MKKLLTCCAAFLLMLSATLESKAEAIIKGHIRNVPKGEVNIQYAEPVLDNLVYFKTELVGDSFEVRINLVDPTEIAFWIGQEHFTVFTMTDDITVVECDAGNISGTISFTGTHTDDNKFLLALENLKGALMKEGMQKGPDDKNEYRLWRKKQNESNTVRMDSLFKTAKNYELSTAFKKDMIDGRNYIAVGSALLTYVFAHATTAGLKFDGGQATTKAEVDSLLKTVRVEHPEALLSQDYIRFLEHYKMYLMQIEDGKLDPEKLRNRKKDEWMAIKFDFLERYFKNEDIRYAVLVNDLGHDAMSMESELFAKWANYVITKYPDKRHNGQLQNMIAGKQELMPGGIAPGFELEDIDGEKVSLSSLKGKVLYVDFWGSWCLPCMYENRKVKKVKEDYKGKNVVFVYVTRDEDKKSWKDAIEKQELTGIHLFACKSTVFHDYQAGGVPHYVLIGKNGRIITSSAPRPSETKELYLLLDNALE